MVLGDGKTSCVALGNLLLIAATFTIYSIVGRNIYKNRVSNVYIQQQIDISCSETTFSTVGKSDLCTRQGSIVRTHEFNVEACSSSPIREPDLSSASTYPQSVCEPSFTVRQLPTPSHAPKGLVSLAREDHIEPPVSPKDTKYHFTFSRTPTHSNTSSWTSRRTRYTTSITGPSNSPLSSLLSPRPCQMNINAMRGAQAYAQVAILLFIVMVVYWVPSTVNRLYSFNHPPNFELSVAAAALLPLQGFFNCVIYCFTSRSQLKGIWRNAKARWWHKSTVVKGSVGSMALSSDLLDVHATPNVKRGTGKQSQLDVLEDLALKYGLDEEWRVGGDSPGNLLAAVSSLP